MRKNRQNFIYAGLAMASLVTGLGLWWASVALGFANPVLLPPPSTVVSAFVEMVVDGSIFVHVAVSLGRAFGGFVIATLIAVPLGICIGRIAWVSAVANPWIEAFRPVPPIALLPLVVMWFGIGETSKLAVICYGAMFPILINTVHGVRAIDNSLLRAARALGASNSQIFWLVVLPGAIPSVITGLRLGASMAVLVLVAAEMLGSTSGLGWLIMDSREHFFPDRIMVGIVTLGLIGYALNHGLLTLERRIVQWRPSQE